MTCPLKSRKWTVACPSVFEKAWKSSIDSVVDLIQCLYLPPTGLSNYTKKKTVALFRLLLYSYVILIYLLLLEASILEICSICI